MTGLMAMSMGVAYPACIAAEMIVRGDITRKGVLSPVTDVPFDLFMDQLNKRGIKVNETIEQLIWKQKQFDPADISENRIIRLHRTLK